MSDGIQISMSAAEWLVSCYDSEELFALVTADPMLKHQVFRGGFKVHPHSVEKRPVRRRIAALLARDAERLRGLLRDVEAPWGPACAVIMMLDTDWLLDYWRELLRGTGEKALAVGMAADRRHGIRQRGERLLRRDPWWNSELDADVNDLPTEVLALATMFAARGAAGVVSSGDDVSAGRLEALERENASLREAVERQRRKVREAEQALQETRKIMAEREKELKRHLQEAKQTLRYTQQDVTRRIAERVHAFKRQALEVPERERVAEQADGEKSRGLIEKAESVLERQAELDSTYGTREAVRARLRQLSRMAERLALCIEESMRLDPEVRRLHAQVMREMERLQEAVQREVVDVHTPELAAQLIAEVKALPPDQEARQGLDRIEALLDIDLIARLLGEPGTAHVREQLERRRRAISELLHESLPSRVPEAEEAPREIWDIESRLAVLGDLPVTVFVDGYNVTKRVADLFECERRAGLAAARAALCDLCQAKGEMFAHLEVVFDGQGTLSERENRGALTVVFSNGLQQSQNADDYLVDRVTVVAARPGQIWLVTDDRGLRERVSTCCDAFIACEDWYDFIAAKRSKPG